MNLKQNGTYFLLMKNYKIKPYSRNHGTDKSIKLVLNIKNKAF